MLFEPIHTTSIDECKLPSLVVWRNEKLAFGNKLWNKEEEIGKQLAGLKHLLFL